jgi:uncharacterized membrane protein YuzA (DUF378 family)
MTSVYEYPKSDYLRLRVTMAAKLIIVIGAILWGLIGVVGYNFLEEWITNSLVTRGIYVVVGLSALIVALDRDFYLSFLGQAVYPCGSLVSKVPAKSDTDVRVRVPPNSNVVYWASEPSKNDAVIDNPWDAYMNYENSGVVKANDMGEAILKIRHPSSYVVPMGKQLTKHVHYRYCFHPGMLSKVHTVYV